MHEIKIIFCFPEKSKAKKQNNDDFRKVVISEKNARKKNNFCPPKKKSKAKTKITTTFRTSLFVIKYRMRCAIHIPLMQKTSQ